MTAASPRLPISIVFIRYSIPQSPPQAQTAVSELNRSPVGCNHCPPPGRTTDMARRLFSRARPSLAKAYVLRASRRLRTRTPTHCALSPLATGVGQPDRLTFHVLF